MKKLQGRVQELINRGGGTTLNQPPPPPKSATELAWLLTNMNYDKDADNNERWY